MRHEAKFRKWDFVVGLGCVVFLLAGLGVVGSGGRRRAKEAVCLSNLKKWGAVWHAFLIDNDGVGPEDLGWWPHLWAYFKNEKLLLCPEATRPAYPPPVGQYLIGGKFSAGAAWYDYDEITWESVPSPGKHYLFSYGYNQWISRNTGNVRGGKLPDGSPKLWGFFPLEAKNAELAPILADSAGGGNTPMPWDTPPEYDGQIYYGGGNVHEIRNFCLNRHNAAVNVLFLDFSARKVGLKGLWYLWWHRLWPIPGMTVGGQPWVEAPPTEWDNPDHWMYNFKDYGSN
jgi:prepilin-type processing-associated H-X9-DG protein